MVPRRRLGLNCPVTVIGKSAVMLPFTEQIVPVVDVAGGRLVLVPPAQTE